MKVLSFKLNGASDIWESSPPETTKQSIVSLSGKLENPFVLLLVRRVIVLKTFGLVKLVCWRLFAHLKQTHFLKSHCFGYQKYYEILLLTALRGKERAALLMFGGFCRDSFSSHYSVSPFEIQGSLSSVIIEYIYLITGKIRPISKMYLILYRGKAFLIIKVKDNHT